MGQSPYEGFKKGKELAEQFPEPWAYFPKTCTLDQCWTFLRKSHSRLASSNGETKHLMSRVFKGCNTRYFLFNFSYGDKVPRSFLGRLFAIAWTLFGLVLMTFLLADITNALISYSMQRSVNKKVYGAKVLFNCDNTKKRMLKKKSCFSAVPYFMIPSI